MVLMRGLNRARALGSVRSARAKSTISLGIALPGGRTDTSATGLARTVRAESDYDPHQSAVLL
jgi:hypothetical protein